MIVSLIIFAIASYLLGAVPFGYMAGRIKGVDIRTMGSGNIGATNTARVLGKGWGALTFFCDALKGFLPVWLFPLLAARFFSYQDNGILAITCAASAVAGHNWPVYLRFKGGKGVAASLGALLGMAPECAGLGLAVWLVVFGTTRYVSIASISAAIAAAAGAWFFHLETGLPVPTALTALAALVIWRHKPNIQRLIGGTEHRFQFRAPADNPDDLRPSAR